MNYTSNKVFISGHEIIQLKHNDLETWFSIIPEYGGALNEFVVNGKVICAGSTSEKEFETKTIQSFAGTQLFPYPNRVNNGTYNYNGKQFELPKNDEPRSHSLHGLIYNQPFKIDTIDCEIGKIEIGYSYQKNHKGFPFEVYLKNTFQLEKDALTITTTIENKGKEEFPFGHGWHPYFRTDTIVDNWQLKIAGSKCYSVDEDLIPNGSIENTNRFLKLSKIGATELNHCFKLDKTDEPIKALLSSPRKNLELNLELEGYNFLQTYIPPNRKSIALEPQTCAPDGFNNQIGLLYLKPNQIKGFKCNIKVIS